MSVYFEKSRKAFESAKLLFEAGQNEGAANRAYYAIFHAAQAVVAQLAPVKPKDIKTHSGLRRLFELHVVRPGLIDKAIARHIKEAEGTQLVADYAEEHVVRAEVLRALRDAEEFIAACDKISREEGT